MGLGDLFEGAAKGVWHGYEHVSDAAWNIAKPVVDSGVYWGKNTSPLYNAITGNKGSEQIVSDATSIGKGAYTGGKFVVQHPKESAQIAKTVGWEVAKQQVLNPENLVINTAMLAATIGSGGMTAPAWMARLGITTEGLEAARGIETGLDVAKGAEAGADIAKGAEAGVDIAKGAKSATSTADAAAAASKASEFANPAINASRLDRFSTANQATYAGIQDARGFGKIDAALDAPRQYMMNARELVGMSREGAVQGFRNSMADRMFPSVAEGEATGLGGSFAKYGYRTVAGGSGPAAEGARTVASDMTWRYGTAMKRINEVTNFDSNVRKFDTVAHGIGDPKWAATQLAKKGVSEAEAHQGEIIDTATKQAEEHGVGGLADQIKDKLFGNKDDAKVGNTPEAVPDVLNGMTVAPWSRPDSNTGFVTSRAASPARQRQLTTTVSGAPDRIGPSSWYGQQESTGGFAGQPGYASGRGFKSTSSWSQDPAVVA